MSNFLEKIKKKMLEIKIIGGNNNINFKDLNEIIFLFKNNESQLNSEVESTLKQYHQSNKNHILYNFCLAIFSYVKKLNGDNYLTDFYNQLIKIGKNNILDLVSVEILKINESEYVLNYLMNIYEQNDKREELIDILKRLLKKKPNQIDLILRIAEKNEKDSLEEAIKYFQLALNKECENKNFLSAFKIWKKILDYDYENYTLLIQLSKKFITNLNNENQSALYVFFLKHLERQFEKNYLYIIKVIKLSLENGVILKNQFNKLIQSYLLQNKEHKNFETILNFSGIKNLQKSSNYLSSFKIMELIKEFEKHIIFDEGTFIKHRNFGIGIIRKIEKDEKLKKITDLKMIIDFKFKKNHIMSFRIALNSLSILSPTHLEALAIFDNEKLNEIKNDQFLILENILKTLNPPCNSKEITDFIVGGIKLFDKEEWKKKWSEIKKLLNQEERFIEKFEMVNKGVRFKEKDVSLEENTLNALRKKIDAKEKIRALDFYYNHFLKTNSQKEKEILETIITLAKSNAPGSLAICVFLNYLIKAYKVEVNLDLDQVFKKNFNLKNFIQEFNFLSNNVLKEIFIEMWYSNLNNDFMNQVVVWLASQETNKELLFNLLYQKDKEFLIKTFKIIKSDFIKFSESFFILFKLLFNYNDEFIKTMIGSCFIKILKINSELHKNITIEKNMFFSKKLFSQINNYLFKDNLLFSALKDEKLISYDEKKLIFIELEKQTFLENYLKVEIRTLDENLKQ